MEHIEPETEPLLNAGQMARRLGVKPRWLRAEAEADRLPAVPAGDTYLFDPATVERVLLKRAQGVPTDDS
jgi:hypothetical protein